jgi:uncharacterized protein
LSVYLDTSILAGLFIETDIFAGRAAAFFADNNEVVIVSDFAATEFASVVARVTRMNRLKEQEARAIFLSFDNWRGQFAEQEDTMPSDIQAPTLTLRRLQLNLRAPDAINLAIALRIDASLATFDTRMIDNACALGISVAAA